MSRQVTNSDVQILSEYEHIRKRPTMYVGATKPIIVFCFELGVGVYFGFLYHHNVYIVFGGPFIYPFSF